MTILKSVLVSVWVACCASLVTGCHKASPIPLTSALPPSSLVLSKNGHLYVMQNEHSTNLKPLLTNDSGQVIGPYLWPNLSPDRKLVAFYAAKSINSGFMLCVIGVDGCNLRTVDNITLPGQIFQVGLSWSPDSKTIAFSSPKTGDNNIFIVKVDGTGEQKITNGQFDIKPAWSPDGRYIAFIQMSVPPAKPALVIYDYSNFMVLTTIANSYWYYWSPKHNELVYAATSTSPGRRSMHLYLCRVEVKGVTKAADLSKVDYPPQRIALWGGWNPAGDRILAKLFTDTVTFGQTARIVSINPRTGGSQVLTTLRNIVDANWSEDRKAIYYTEWGADSADFLSDVDLYIMNTDGGRQRLLLRGIQNPDW